MSRNAIEKAVVSALEDIKAHDIVVLDVTRMTSLFDKMVIASADSTRQTRALANHVQEKAKAQGATVHGIEGLDAGEWVLVDLGDLVVHIMVPAVREYYNLEQLWGGAPAPQARSRQPPFDFDRSHDAAET
ncbi:MAG: ribosome silencing factor [Betaproteobacteria bacterium]|nr:ribosome silencing factor [Betaproteobacteria bacterium]